MKIAKRCQTGISAPRRRCTHAAALFVALLVGGPVFSAPPDDVKPAGAESGKSTETDDEVRRMGRKLVRKAIKGGEEDLMQRLVRMMGDAAKRLDLTFDAGEETQLLQKKILEDLDDAIKLAASRTRRVPRSSKQPPGDRRKMDKPQEADAEADQKRRQGGEPREVAGKGGVKAGKTVDNSMEFDVRRGWGSLPPRERDEVIQGFREASLEAFRAWINEYYRALQDSE